MDKVGKPIKYPSTPHWPTSLGLGGGDSYSQHYKNLILSPIVITEKLDGGNTSLYNGNVYARSISTPSNDGWMALVKKYHAWKTLVYKNIQFYGEDLSAKHSIGYEINKEQTFHLFSVRKNDIFCSWEEVEEWARVLDVPTVPVIKKGIFTEKEINNIIMESIGTPSFFGPNKEGFVIRLQNEFNICDLNKNVCKWVRKNHVQSDKHWSRNWSWNIIK